MFNSESPQTEQHPMLALAQRCSPYLERTLQRYADLTPSLAAHLQQPYFKQEMVQFLNLTQVKSEPELKHLLRRLRIDVLSRLIVRDLNGLADLQEVMRTTTHLAEICLSFATTWWSASLREVYGDPCAVRKNIQTHDIQSLIVVGMGKLGGGELNVSSDIDLIFAYEEEGETNGKTVISNHEYFTKLCRKLINTLDEVTEDGFVFRVDMRLRPFGSEGSLACSLDALENYYQTYGREWERYAWIKGRVVVGPSAKLEKLLKPFVFRKYLDFSVIANLRSLKDQIQQDVKRRDLHENIKLGRGGIREIEFIAQLFQLIRGGKDPDLQMRPTLEVLQTLASKHIVDQQTVETLQKAYVFFRNLEHRLQYYADAQTHDLPKTDAHRLAIAIAMQSPDWNTLRGEVIQHREVVENVFNKIFSYQQTAVRHVASEGHLWKNLHQNDEVIQRIASLGYSEPLLVLEKLFQLKNGPRVMRLPEMSQTRLNTVMPMLIESCGKHSNAMDTLIRALTLIETICRRASYLAFFAEYPNVLDRLIDLLSASPWLANYITQHPILVDNLSTSASYEDINFPEQQAYILNQLRMFAGDTEQQMNLLREFHQKILFKIACEDVVNNILLTRVSTLLSALADIILQVVIQVVWDSLPYRHCESPHFAIIAYGKYGSRELGYSSDLDLVFLYDDSHPEARDIYSKFGARIISWLNTFTSSGMLYEIDMQLRPDGNSGLLVSSIEGFFNYQMEKAWVWEHQALTRARFVAGDSAVGEAFDHVRNAILTQNRDWDNLTKEILHMRKRMKDAHPYVAGKFDLKQDMGGMIDIEFIAQFLILFHARNHVALLQHWGTAEIIYLCAELDLIDENLGNQVSKCYYMYRSLQHAMRLQGHLNSRMSDEAPGIQEAILAVRTLWKQTFKLS